MAVRTMTSEGPRVSGVLSIAVSRGRKLTGVLLIDGEELVDLVTNLSIGNLDIILGLTVIGHQGEETIIRDVELRGEGLAKGARERGGGLPAGIPCG
jgi:hypothetical protein